MNLIGLTATQKNELIQFVSNELHAYAVILFGSAAKNMLRPDSDVDIAFLSDNIYSPYDIFMAAQSLADLLHREVDLIDFRAASSVFKAQIVDKGIVLYESNPVKRQYAFLQALKEYTMLNDERYEILERHGFAGGIKDDKGRNSEQTRDHSSLHPEN